MASVDISGLAEPQIEIILNIKRMQGLGISIHQLRSALHNIDFPPGKLRQGSHEEVLLVRGRFADVGQLENLPLQFKDGYTIRLEDLASVREIYPEQQSKKRINGYETILITLQREQIANVLTVARRVFHKVQTIREQLPPETQLVLVDDASARIRQDLSALGWRSLFALAAILVILRLGLGRTSGALMIVISVLMAMLAVVTGIYAMRYSLNLLTMAGIALGFGFMVDNAILVYENIRRLGGGVHIAQAVQEMLPPLLAATLTTLAAIAPFIFLTGELRIYYWPFGVVMAITLLMALIFALFYIPSAIRLIMEGKILTPSVPKERNWSFVIQYRRILGLLFRRRWLVWGLVILLIGLPLWLLPHQLDENENTVGSRLPVILYNRILGSDLYTSIRPYSDAILGGALYLFFNKIDRGTFWRWQSPTYLAVHLRLPQGSALGLSENNILVFEQMALETDGVSRVETNIWPSGAWLRIDFSREASSSFIPYQLKEQLINRAARMSGLSVSVSGYGEGFSGGMMGFTSASFYLYFRGYNFKELERQALRFKNLIERNSRVRHVDINAQFGFSLDDLYYFDMDINRQLLRQKGLSLATVLNHLNLYTSEYLGYEYMTLGGQERPLRLKASGFETIEMDRLFSDPQVSGDSLVYRFEEIGYPEKRKTTTEIRRENQQYIRMVSFDFLGPYQFARAFLNETLDSFSMPIGYSVEVGRSRKMDTGNRDIFMVVIIGLLLIYMVTAALYESFRLPFLIFLTIPSGFIGIVWAFYLTDTAFTATAYIGTIFISGFVVNNSILLVNRMNNYLEKGFTQELATLGGAADHLRPIILTTTTTIAGFLPLVLFSRQMENDIWFTLSLAGIGGMTSSFLFIILILPVLFYRKRES